MLNKDEWVLFDNNSPGYAGQHRNELWAERDARFGAGNWRSIWLAGGDYLEYQEACLLYEEAYFKYFETRPELLDFLLEIASDVYDDDPSNVKSGLLGETWFLHPAQHCSSAIPCRAR